MTSIAWDGVTLACDGQITANGCIESNSFKKVRRIKAEVRRSQTIALGLAGDMCCFSAIEEWIKSGCIPSEFPDKTVLSGIIVTEKSAFCFDSDNNGQLFEISGSMATGSGSHFCLSAMLLGLDAKAAVKHAIQLDPFSGGKVTSIRCR